jgi:hypothetical protein
MDALDYVAVKGNSAGQQLMMMMMMMMIASCFFSH